MKTILSRKGFDSQNGGIPSPILHENGEYTTKQVNLYTQAH